TIHYPMDPPDPIEAIKFRMEQQGLTRKDLEGIIGTRARIAEVLSGKRELSIAMIRRLNTELKIPAEILIRRSSKRAA
ncbi:MAG: helix-turn-helix domain-containing protein, partial [Hyphomicrobiales bacterium]|nr:helix-turn-helix domain-containing protein [Hyphomicrobiales bacterium]